MGSCASLSRLANLPIGLATDTGGHNSTEGEHVASHDGEDVNKPLQTIQAHREEINCIAVSADASLIASGSDDCSVRVWSVENFDCLREFLGHSDYITCVVFAGHGVLSGSGDMTIRKWDLISGDCVFVSSLCL